MKNNILIQSANIFDTTSDLISLGNTGVSVIIPHVCNNANIFGAGFAAAVGNRYPIVKENYHLLGSTFLKNNLGYTQFITVKKNQTHGHKLIFANMIAQNGIVSYKNKRPINYYALCKSMDKVKDYIVSNFDSSNPVQIHTPKFGSGLAGGNWNFIQDLITDIWGDFFVTVYNYQPKTSRSNVKSY